jgi:hypothetical protein
MAAIDINEKRIVKAVSKSFANVVIIGDYIYLMKNEEDKSHSGFFIQSLSSFWDDENKEINFGKAFKLSSAIGGYTNLLEFF